MSEFEQSIAERLKSASRIRETRRRSLLDSYKYELLQLDGAGCRGSELQRWLGEKGVKVQLSTVTRWLHGWSITERNLFAAGENAVVEFDALAVAERLKSESRNRRKQQTFGQRRSVLDIYIFDLLKLDAAGCSCGDLQRWLAERGLKIQRSTVNRWLHRNRLDG